MVPVPRELTVKKSKDKSTRFFIPRVEMQLDPRQAAQGGSQELLPAWSRQSGGMEMGGGAEVGRGGKMAVSGPGKETHILVKVTT